MDGIFFRSSVTPPISNFAFDLQRFDVTEVSSLAELTTALSNGGEIKLIDDIEITSSLSIKKTVTLDLNGKTITCTYSRGDAFDVSTNGIIFTVNDSAGGGKISNAGTTGTRAPIYMASTGGKFTMNGGSIESNATVNINDYGTVKINGGTFKSNNADNESFIISKIDESKSYTYLDGVIYVGDEDYVTGITSNSSYTSIAIDGTTKYYTTPELAENAKVASIGEGDNIKYYSSLKAAHDAASAGDVVTVIKNINFVSEVSITKNLTLDLNGKTVSYSGTGNAFKIIQKSTFTVKDSGNDGKISSSSRAIYIGAKNDYGTFILDSGTLEATGTEAAVYVFTANSAVNVTGGTITGTKNIELNSSADKNKIKITGGTFSSDVAQYIDANTNSIFLDGTLYVGSSIGDKTETDYSVNLDGNLKYYSTLELQQDAIKSAVASIGSGTDIKYYTTLQKAVDAASADDTIALTQDITLSSAINVTKTFTLDLNGKTLTKGTTTTAPIIYVKTLSGSQGNLTLKDSGTGGKVTGKGYILYIGESDTSSGTFTLESGTIQSTNNYGGIFVYSSSTANINGGTVTGSNYAIGVRSGSNVSVASGSEYPSATIDGKTYYYDTEEKYNTAISQAVAYIERDGSNLYYTTFSNASSALQSGDTLVLTEKGLSTAVAYIERDGKRNYYDSLSKAFEGSTDGDTVVLCNDIELQTTFTKKWTVTLDLAGHTICPTSTSMSGYVLRVDAPANNDSKGHLIIDDSVGGGTIGGENYGYGIYITGYQKKNTSGNYTLNVPAKLTVNAGTIQGFWSGILGNGTLPKNDGKTAGYGNTIITINGGTIRSLGKHDELSTNPEDVSTGIYQPQEGTLTINGGTVEGETGLEIRAGTLNVTGGTITGTAKTYKSSVTPSSGGSTSRGAGISVSPYDDRNITVNIGSSEGSGSDINISGANAMTLGNKETKQATSLEVTINDGNFESTSTSGDSGSALYIDDAKADITVNNGNFAGNVTVAENAVNENNQASLTVNNATVGGDVVIEDNSDVSENATVTLNDGTYEGKIQDNTVKTEGGTTTKTITIKSGTYTKATASELEDLMSEDLETTKDENGYTRVVEKTIGWKQSGSDNVYNYLIGTEGSPSTVATVTLTNAALSSALISDSLYGLLGIPDDATFTWGGASSGFALTKYSTTAGAINITPQSAGVKIQAKGFVGNATTLTASGSNAIYVDATNNSLTNITGGGGDDTLLAGTRNTTLVGGEGNDTLQGNSKNDSLVGGAGNDLFIYTGGKDTIGDFGTGNDIVKTSLTPITDVSKISAINGGFALNFDRSNTLTFQNADSKVVSLTNGTDHYSYTAASIAHGKGISLGANYGNVFDATNYNTVDASAVTGNITITDNTNANYIVAGKGKNTFNITGGNDTIVGYDTVDAVIVADTYTPPTNFNDAVFDNSDATINFGSGNSLTFKTASEVILTKGNDTYTYNRNSIAWANNGITLGSAYTSKFFNGVSDNNSAYVSINAADVNHALRITGNDKNNYLVASSLYGGTLIGGEGADTLVAGSIGAFLNGGDSDDSLIGGNGNDTFAYTGGDDTIHGYSDGDLVSVAAGINVAGATVTTSGDNLVLDFDDNKLTFVDGVGKTISLKSGRRNYEFSKDSIVQDKGITLTANHAGGNFSEGETYDTIDASLVEHAISITGNNHDNYIAIGKAGGSLYGGKGDDTLYGGAGDDIFRYTAGDDVIFGYGTGDSLSIDSPATKITNARTGNRRLTLTMNDKAKLVFRSDDEIPAQISLAGGGYLTQDGVVDTAAKSLKLFSSAKGRIDLNDELYSDAGIESVSAVDVKGQSVTLVGGTQGGSFTFYDKNKKHDVFEYNGGKVTINHYETGRDKINLGDYSISAFDVGSGTNANNVFISLNGGTGDVISLTGAVKGKEVLIHQPTSRGNSYQKMVFADTGVLYDKEKATSATLWANAEDYTATLSTLKRITLGEGVSSISVTANNNKNLNIDASKAGEGISLVSGAKNDKFTGSGYADMFVYTAGKDIIQDFNATADQISLDGGDKVNLYDAKITAGKKSVRFKFESSKNTLTLKPTKGEELGNTITIDGEERTYFKNAIVSADGKTASLTSSFGGTYKVGKDLAGITEIDGHLAEKKLTVKGTTSAETILGGKKKTLFKGGGGADNLVGGEGEDTFFYAKGDKDSVTIADFDFENDKLKIPAGTLSKVSTTAGGVQFAMKEGRSTDAPEVGWFNLTSFKKNNVDADMGKVLIKANNTYYWFADGTETLANDDTLTANEGALVTSVNKINKSQTDGYDIIELNYSTNLIKSEVAVQVKDTLKAHT